MSAAKRRGIGYSCACGAWPWCVRESCEACGEALVRFVMRSGTMPPNGTIIQRLAAHEAAPASEAPVEAPASEQS